MEILGAPEPVSSPTEREWQKPEGVRLPVAVVTEGHFEPSVSPEERAARNCRKLFPRPPLVKRLVLAD